MTSPKKRTIPSSAPPRKRPVGKGTTRTTKGPSEKELAGIRERSAAAHGGTALGEKYIRATWQRNQDRRRSAESPTKPVAKPRGVLPPRTAPVPSRSGATKAPPAAQPTKPVGQFKVSPIEKPVRVSPKVSSVTPKPGNPMPKPRATKGTHR